jgi:hypothetical protein
MTKKYPLDPLLRLRKRRTDDAMREFAAAVRAREAASKRRLAAEGERARAEVAAGAVRDAERGALERGEVSAGDLMRVDAWEARVREERALLERQLVHAGAREQEARVTEEGARSQLATLSAEAEAVEKDRGQWAERERKKGEAKEEEAGAEAWRPRRA